eukprot:gnl/TRDRNA2_/TRDRNA2_110698_c1_seq1.p1 gnl/TRDRNA2_/TRDRNA2_110698_c1~~gnl/TRDRNA2_/TRDRNA2_110698_c1_seq1.p1  ORF type:complete len:710 (-),score=80.27 gnl/TRDRNA2_/TRDRNA2_110698_c1_seq1:187-2229(-)
MDAAGWTPLHVAVCMGRQDVVPYLLQGGAQLRIQNARGQMPEDLCSHPWMKEVLSSYDAHLRAKPSEVILPRRTCEHVAFEHCSSGSNINCPPGGALHFEPFFVPRIAVLHEPAHREDMRKLGVELFNRSPGHGLAFLVAAGAVRDYPVELNGFLARSGTDPACFGELLGEDFPIAQTLRLEFLNSLPLLGTGVVSALETAFQDLAVPLDFQKVDRLTCGIAHFWWRQHEESSWETQLESGAGNQRSGAPCSSPRGSRSKGLGNVPSGPGARGELTGHTLQGSLLATDTLHRLMFSTLMLHRCFHNPDCLHLRRIMTLNEWIELNTGFEGNGSDVPVHIQASIYRAIADNKAEFRAEVPVSCPSLPMTIEGWAFVTYSGRPQIRDLAHGAPTSARGSPSGWPEADGLQASPRVLAAQGGVTSVGCSLPTPRPPEDPLADLAQATPRPQPTPRPSGKDELLSECEVVWLSLYNSLLLLSSGAGVVPYAFISLRHVLLSESDAAAMRLCLACRPEPGWPPLATDQEWLELCLLLGDGRFQLLEAPNLELRFESASDFHAWAARLGELCYDDPMPSMSGRHVGHGVSPKASSLGAGARLNSCPDDPVAFPPLIGEDLWPEDTLDLKLPPLPGETESTDDSASDEVPPCGSPRLPETKPRTTWTMPPTLPPVPTLPFRPAVGAS